MGITNNNVWHIKIVDYKNSYMFKNGIHIYITHQK